MADIPVLYYNQAADNLSNNNPRWWKENDKDLYKHIFSYTRGLLTDQGPRRMQWLQFARLYQNQNPTGFFSGVGSTSAVTLGLKDSPAVNVVKSCIDTAGSKIGKSKPRPVFLTEDGNYAQQTRAELLTQYMDGQFDAMHLYEKAASVFRDGSIFGTGALKIYIDHDKGSVECERIMPDELLVDDGEAIYGAPRQIHQMKYVSRDVLCEMFPKYKGAIFAAPLALQGVARAARTPDLVRIIESWHLPSGKNADDGKHCITIETCTLFSESYTKDFFPFVSWRWTPRVAGFWGMGLAEELFGTQLEISKILRNIQQAQNLIAVPRVYVQNGSVVSSSMLNNEIGAIVKYTGNKPEFFTPTAMNSEIYTHLRWLIDSAYQSTGISQLSAASQKPAGLESGVALREYQDIESERFTAVGQRWEEFFLEATKIIVALTKDLVELGYEGKVKVAGKKFMETLDWKKVNLDEDRYVLRCFAANILPTTPAGRLQKVQELMQAGIIPKEWGLKLLDFPDLQGYMNQTMSSSDLCAKMIDSILLKGDYISPEPDMNLLEAQTMGHQRKLEAVLQNVDPMKIDLLARWLEAVKTMLPGQEVMAQEMQPMANPAQAPQSDLISNVPM